MKKLHGALHKVLTRPLPDSAQCDVCKYFDTTNPTVIETLRENNPQHLDKILYQAKCRCDDRFHAKEEKQKKMWNESNIPNRYGNAVAKTFGNFHVREGTKTAFDAAFEFGIRQGNHIMTLVGTYGSGKSHLLEAISREWVHDGYSVKYEYVPTMLNELRSASQKPESNSKSLYELLQEKFKTKLLILDDLGQENPTDWTRKILTEIVDERLRTDGWLLCATNYTDEQIKKRIDERFASRLFDRAKTVVLTCENYG